MSRNRELIRRFHEVGGQPTRESAGPITNRELVLRLRLHFEEQLELAEAMLGAGRDAVGQLRRAWDAFEVELKTTLLVENDPEISEYVDLEAIAGELADDLVIAYGTAEFYGIDLDVAYEAVMEANLRKIPDCDAPGCLSGFVVRPIGTGPGERRPEDTLISDPCEACGGSGKGPPILREDGKILKPDGWEPADLGPALRVRRRRPEEVPEVPRESDSPNDWPPVGVDPETGGEAEIR